jgi:hypothetical protein
LEEKPQEIAVRIEEPQAQTPAKTADRILGEIGDLPRDTIILRPVRRRFFRPKAVSQ